MEATWWLNEQLQDWLGEENVADTLTQSVPHNVMSQMGLPLLDVADVIRPHPEVVAFMHDVGDEGFPDELAELEGGREARDAMRAYLDKCGMRCVGEIDITRPRLERTPHQAAAAPSLSSAAERSSGVVGRRGSSFGCRRSTSRTTRLSGSSNGRRMRSRTDGNPSGAARLR
jgi:rifampicin phosphotransferase